MSGEDEDMYVVPEEGTEGIQDDMYVEKDEMDNIYENTPQPVNPRDRHYWEKQPFLADDEQHIYGNVGQPEPEQELYENVDKPPPPQSASTLKPSPQPKNLLKPAPQPKGDIVRKLSEAWEQKKKENAAKPPERGNTFPSRKVTPPMLTPTSRRPDDNDVFEEGNDVKSNVKDSKEKEDVQKSSSDLNSSAAESSKSSATGSGNERKTKSTTRKKKQKEPSLRMTQKRDEKQKGKNLYVETNTPDPSPDTTYADVDGIQAMKLTNFAEKDDPEKGAKPSRDSTKLPTTFTKGSRCTKMTTGLIAIISVLIAIIIGLVVYVAILVASASVPAPTEKMQGISPYSDYYLKKINIAKSGNQFLKFVGLPLNHSEAINTCRYWQPTASIATLKNNQVTPTNDSLKDWCSDKKTTSFWMHATQKPPIPTPTPPTSTVSPPSDVITPSDSMEANDVIMKSSDVIKLPEMCESSTGYESCKEMLCFVCSVHEDNWVEK